MSHAKAGDIKKSNAFYANLYSPANINKYAQQFNPWIWNAINGQQGTTGFSKDLYNILQGKDISPYLLNQPLNQINQGANQNLAKFQSLVGRNNAGGGLANAYGLANLGGRNTAVANLMNQYGQWREQQRRSDINWGLGQVQNSQNMGFNSANAYGNKWQVKPSWLDHLANSLAAGSAAYSGQQQPQATYQMNPPPNYGPGTTDSFGNVPNASNSTPNYQDPGTYPYGASNGQFNSPNVYSSGGINNPYPGSTSTIQTNGSWDQYRGYQGGGV
jgi:hypothetical protein